LIGTVGQIALRKGHDVMALAMLDIAVSNLNAHWVIVGQRYSDKAESRQFEASLHELATAGPLAGRIHFLGDRNDMPAIYAELALIAHPARQEPLGRVLLEAGACGLPVVATAVGGTSEIYPTELHAAWLVPPGDADALAAAIAAILSDEGLATKMGTAARLRIEASFDRHLAAEGLIRHYRDLL
jgi:glycosyltransferase involved in cell wall biosynthesis